MDAKHFPSTRTSGDGMENVDLIQTDVKLKQSTNFATNLNENADNVRKSASAATTPQIPGAFSIYRANNDDNSSVKLPAKTPQGKMFYLVPHLVNVKKSCTLKNKEPKFVPFEPYKAAVSMILPLEKCIRQVF